ncbi:PTS IIA-like nitrogen regulatory protein PtsN [Simonsiella muelleri]|uniref:PTS IIA-like nitrogen-regulatory protein PtsN n=1 Tax=Simonsiella muelleri ATCC 29453 TaxID=641147 RepID=V9HCX1_9NEIS|nr:PTS IIA-like nitrogen regulatory protein PtsN [Simonsiella muelleri]AUX61277.1 PTS IIA-like nitrogen-regulatory protein PtsN [Simonsiella muelleri ATCC 29453]EFG31220.1 PTS IIA-like nitrogen-regulatory protein PtsN [Simonsiella muelleri ATCC 29453]UBQ53333.1 PTS IIA-like nitrogen regulatory protein PtsN [Simonsiella muelleri]
MKAIGEILPVSHIVLDLDVSSKKRLFEEVGKLLETDSGLSQSDVFDCLFAREKLGSTGLGHGVAIPHGRHANVSHITAAFVRTAEAIDFDAPDNQPVSLIFVLLVPEQATGEHLEILSYLASQFSDKNVRELLQKCTDAAEVTKILSF